MKKIKDKNNRKRITLICMTISLIVCMMLQIPVSYGKAEKMGSRIKKSTVNSGAFFKGGKSGSDKGGKSGSDKKSSLRGNKSSKAPNASDVKKKSLSVKKSHAGHVRGGENETSFLVRKVWSDGNASHINDSVKVQLLRDGKEYGSPAVINASHGWKHTFTGLQYEKSKGKPYNYSVREEPVDGYDIEYGEKKVMTSEIDGTRYELVKYSDIKPADELVMVAEKEDGRRYVVEAETTGSKFSALKCDKRADIVENVLYNPGSLWQVAKSKHSSKYYTIKHNGIFLSRNLQGKTFDDGYNTLFDFKKDKSEPETQNVKRFIADKDGDKYLAEHAGGIVSVYKHYFLWYYNTKFSFYKKTKEKIYAPAYAQTIYNDKISIHKRIDSLRDNKPGSTGKNSETDVNGKKDYRLYLDVTGGVREKPIDVLLVVDNTGSMVNNKFMFNGNMVQRDFAANELVNGIGSTHSSQSKAGGLVSDIMNMNKQNKVAVMTFCGSAWSTSNKDTWPGDKDKYTKSVQGWTTLAKSGSVPYADVRYKEGGSTNYSSALLRANEFLKDREVRNDGNDKYMIFISDGLPNAIMEKTGEDEFIWRQMSQDTAETPTIKFYQDYFLPKNFDTRTFTIGIRSTGQLVQYKALEKMSNPGDYYLAESGDQIKEAFEKIKASLYPSNVRITDQLSKYVNMNTTSPDLKVVREYKDTGGQIKKEIVWRVDGAINSAGGNIGRAVNGGEKFIGSVNYTPSSSAESTGSIKLKFKDNYSIGSSNKYTLSFNVKSNFTAKKELTEKQGKYPDKGDKDTDLLETKNNTSSLKAGFYSNRSAIVEYETASGKFTSKRYPKPVVQSDIDLKFKKIDSEDNGVLPGAKFRLYYAKLTGSDESLISNWHREGPASAELQSGVDGTFLIADMETGYYILEETFAPKGYEKGKDRKWYISFTDKNGIIVYNSKGEAFRPSGKVGDNTIVNGIYNISNTKLYKLPNAGGSGTYIFYVVGTFITILALLFIRRTCIRI